MDTFCVAIIVSFKHKLLQKIMKQQEHRSVKAVESFGTEIKTWKCNQCNKTFSSKPGFDRHTLHHTGKYSYFCGLCRKGFTQCSHYKRHMKRHDGTQGTVNN